MKRRNHEPAASAAAPPAEAAAALPAPGGDHPRTLVPPPPRLQRRVFPGRPDQAASARRFIAAVLTRCPAASDAILLTSELVANAIQHTATGAGGGFEVAACHYPDGLRVTVTDDGSDSTPALVSHTALATSGHGLLIVEVLADRWGHWGNRRSLSVWFEIDCHDCRPPHD